jgi:osmotically-inducible protein OsmY
VLPAERRLAERLRGVLRDRLRSRLAVSIEHETAILRGVVASPYDRTLAGHLARFEPGVRNVKNELTVAPASASPNAEGPMQIRLLPE